MNLPVADSAALSKICLLEKIGENPSITEIYRCAKVSICQSLRSSISLGRPHRGKLTFFRKAKLFDGRVIRLQYQ